jgi:hypothetical protein
MPAVRLYKGFLYSVDAHITNDWFTIDAMPLEDGSELTGDDIDGDVTIQPAVISPPR